MSNKKFIVIQNLQNEFEISMKEYLKEYYIKKNNFFYKYLSKFYSIEPNNNSIFKNETLKNFSIINGKLKEKILEPGACFHIPPGAAHQEEALTDCVVIDASTTHFNDRVRVEKEYGLNSEGGLPSTTEDEVQFK